MCTSPDLALCGMPLLVAIDLPGGAGFVDTLKRVWDDGNAVFPLDRRLPPAAQARMLATIVPDRIVDERGDHRFAATQTVPGSPPPLEPGDAVVVATSGSTGAPKGVVLTHAAITASAQATSRRLAITNDDRWLACLPLAHVGGLCVVSRALALGTALVVHDGFDADAVERAARNGVTAVSLVATALQRIDPKLFRVILLGGARPPADRPANTVATYGLSETGSGVVYDGVPLEGVDVRIEPDGEISLHGPMLLRGYRDGSIAFGPDGWFHTADLGRWLPDGRLHVDGRRGDLIITGGENVWPERVEAALAIHPDVADVAVAGLADAEWGQRVVVWIVPRSGTLPTLAGMRDWIQASHPGFMAPKELHLVETIPRTALGKIARAELTASITAGKS